MLCCFRSNSILSYRGGQPHDIGEVNGIPVLDVQSVNGEIRHFLDRPVDELEGNQIEGVINWERRFDHMQQHAGQHILSAVLEDIFGYKTISFHLGKDLLTIDLNVEELTDIEINEVEKRANQIILNNYPIKSKWIKMSETKQYQLRKEPSVNEDIRLVMIPSIDYNPCGGTHPLSTGEVMAIKILGWERHKKMVRLLFVCGYRVLKQMNQKHTTLMELTTMLSSPEHQIPEAVKRVLDNQKELEQKVKQLENELLSREARELQNNQSPIIKIYNNRSINELKIIAQVLVRESNDASVFFASLNDKRIQIVATKGKNSLMNIKAIISQILPLINGKGGGSETFVQAGGETTLTTDEIVNLFHELLKKQQAREDCEDR